MGSEQRHSPIRKAPVSASRPSSGQSLTRAFRSDRNPAVVLSVADDRHPARDGRRAGLGGGAAVTLRSHAGVIEIEPADLGERLRAEARQGAARLRDDSAYPAEMRSVREDMESVRAW